MIRGLIFDLDGVIVNTQRNHYMAWKQIADDLGISFTEKENESLKGLSRKDSLFSILALGKVSLKQKKIDELLSQKNELYKYSIRNLNKLDILYGVEELLKEAKNKNISLAIGSSSKNASFILDKLELTHYFKIIVDGCMVNKPKPNPEVFNKALDFMNLSARECIVFEDAASGVQAAKDGGFRVVAVGNENIKYMADEYLNNMKEFNLSDYERII